MKNVTRILALTLPVLAALGCNKKDDPIAVPPEPSATSAATTAVADQDATASSDAVKDAGSAVPSTTGTTQPPRDAGVKQEGGVNADGGKLPGIPPIPTPPAGFPSGFPIPSAIPPIPTGLPTAFPFPVPKSS